MSPLNLTARALLLDMDGTLLDSDAVVERVWRSWAEARDVDPARVFAIMHGRQAYATMAELLPERPMAEHRADAARLLARETADTEGVVPIPGAQDFLAAIAGAPHALVTSADAALSDARMAAAGLRMPDVRITAESVSASKPDPEGFLKGAAELGVDPADCLVFEDSAAGIAAARAAGMRVIGVGPRAAALAPTAYAATLEQVRVEAAPRTRPEGFPPADGLIRLTVSR
ncbi:HAD-IA family hydrolase [Streptomyces johnsoniae]|uniref:HAD-IA family hydrolase n=1 Tax=Streptomyces johnsoniae TaxID=3075532 RepID=A0ABU2S6G3_9ACTN|nr:HAD-IA family hydrolase [Streptomyces sp. DSM 41886]MDT0443705.1 HAD-IA family hydrolase [Streptomyces sp. DSM 41886]